MPNDPLSEIIRGSLIEKHARKSGVDPELVRRVVGQESRGNRRAVSPKGAQGLMQLMPETGKSLGVTDPFDVNQNLDAGTRYLRQQLDTFGTPELALAAYNAGPGAVKKFGNKVPRYRETQDYVKKIGAGYQGTGYAQDPLSEITQRKSYDTKLAGAEEKSFQEWKRQHAPKDSGDDYDLRGAFKAGLKPDANGHWPDTFKKPNHPTFSNESQYATGENKGRAGRWQGETFISPSDDVDPLTAITQTAKTVPPVAQSESVVKPAGKLTDPIPEGVVGVEPGGAQGHAHYAMRRHLEAGDGRGAGELRKALAEDDRRGAMSMGDFRKNEGILANTQRDVAQGQSISERRMGRAPGTQSARLLEPKLTAEEEVLRRTQVGEEQAEKVRQDEQWHAAHKEQIDNNVNSYRKAIQVAGSGFHAGGVNKWLAEMGAKGGAGLAEFLGGLPGTKEGDDLLRVHAEAMVRAAQEEGADRNAVSKFAQDIAGGFIGTAPELAAMSLGVPAVAAFGGGGGVRAQARGESVVEGTTHGAVTGAAFGLGKGGEGLRGALKHAGAVGAGTAAIELAAGRPLREAAVTGATNAAMVGVPAAIGGRGRAREAKQESQAVDRQNSQAKQVAETEVPVRAETGARDNSVQSEQHLRGVPVEQPHHSTSQPRRSRNVASGKRGQFKSGKPEAPTKQQIVETPPSAVAFDGKPREDEAARKIPANESVLRSTKDATGSDVHPLAKAILRNPEWTQRVLEEVGEGAKAEQAQLGRGALTFTAKDGDTVKISNAYGNDKPATLGTKSDGLVIERISAKTAGTPLIKSAIELPAEDAPVNTPSLPKGEKPSESRLQLLRDLERKSERGALNLGSAKYIPAKTPILQEVERATQSSPPRTRRSVRGLVTRAQTAFTSQFTPLRALEKSLYGDKKIQGVDMARKFEQVAGAAGKAEADVIEFRTRVVDPIRTHADDFNSYLFLKRVADRISKDADRKQVAGWTVEKAEQGLQELRGKVGEDVMGQLENAGQVYQSEMRRALRLQVESGRMSKDLYQKILGSNDFYAPFKVLKYVEESEGLSGSGRRIATTQDLSKAITGIHDKDFQLGNFLQVSAEQIVRSRILAEKNLKMLELDRLADLDPKGDLIARVSPDSSPKPNYERVRYFKDGEVSVLEVQKPVARAVQGLNEAQTGLLTKALIIARNPLRVGATSANAAFQIVNGFADTARLALISRYGLRSPLDAVRFPMDWTYSLFSSFKGNFGKPNDLYMDFLKSGAANSTIQRELSPGAFKPTLGLARGPRHLAKSVIDTVPKISNAIEESAKLLGLKRGLRIERIAKLQGEAQKQAMERLVTEVRNYAGSPDFARRGSEMRNLNLLVMFLNARVQGSAADISRLAGRTGAKDSAVAWARMGIAVGLPTTALALINLSDEYRDDYFKIPEWERKNYWMIPRDSFFVSEDTEERVRDYWRIPKRNIFQPFANTIESAIEFAQGREPKTVSKWAMTFLEDLSPINIEGENPTERLESAVGSLNPALKLPVEIGTGRDTFRHRDIVPEYMQKAAPEEQYRASTPEGYVKAGKATGISPLKLEHVASGATGGALSQFSMREPQPGRSSLGQYPVARRFVRSGQVADEGGRGERIQEAEQKESSEQVARRREAIKALSEWRNLPEKDIDAKVVEIKKSDLKLGEKIEQFRDERKKGMTYLDKQIAALGIESGARKDFIVKEMARMKTQAERSAFIEDLKRKGLIPRSANSPREPQKPRKARVAAGANDFNF